MEIAEIQELMLAYDIGSVLKVESLTQGYANENLKVTTSSGPVLFRICKQQPLPLLKYELRLMEALKNFKLKAAFPIADKCGGFIQSQGTNHVMLYEFKAGKEPQLTAAVAHQMGIAVGKLSQIPLTEGLQKKNAVHLDNCQQLITNFSKCKNSMPDVFDYFEEQTAYLIKNMSSDLPKGVVHGDLFPNNTIFEGEELIALIDFEEACSDHLLFDVGMTINGFCFVDNELNAKLLNAFLRGYQIQRQLTSEEWIALPQYMQWASHGMLSWHLSNDLINIPNEAQHDRVLELMQRTQWMRAHENEIQKMVN